MSVLLILLSIGLIYLNIFMKVCRNINQIKICMETGRMVVLLNLHNLYESLYGLLNQVSHIFVMLHMSLFCLRHSYNSKYGLLNTSALLCYSTT